MAVTGVSSHRRRTATPYVAEVGRSGERRGMDSPAAPRVTDVGRVARLAHATATAARAPFRAPWRRASRCRCGGLGPLAALASPATPEDATSHGDLRRAAHLGRQAPSGGSCPNRCRKVVILTSKMPCQRCSLATEFIDITAKSLAEDIDRPAFFIDSVDHAIGAQVGRSASFVWGGELTTQLTVIVRVMVRILIRSRSSTLLPGRIRWPACASWLALAPGAASRGRGTRSWRRPAAPRWTWRRRWRNRRCRPAPRPGSAR